ncbi:unnamed protein product [Closterium sp. Yama58-4]|nr:unnamed protein product [Closterium sp. Yama58-4]
MRPILHLPAVPHALSLPTLSSGPRLASSDFMVSSSSGAVCHFLRSIPVNTFHHYCPAYQASRGESLKTRQWKVVAGRATSDLVDAVAGTVVAAVNKEMTGGKGGNELRHSVHVLQERNRAVVTELEQWKRELVAVKEELEVVKQWRRAVIEGRLELDVKEELRESKGDQQKIWKRIQSATASRSTILDLSHHSRLSDSILGLVSTMTHLKSIDLSHCSGFSAAGVQHLYRLPQLERLDMDNTALLDSALEPIGAANSLNHLSLLGTNVTDAGLRHLTGLHSLTAMWLNRCVGVTSAGMVHVGKLTRLEKLSLFGTAVDDSGVRQLTSLTRLKKLWLPDGREVDYKGLCRLLDRAGKEENEDGRVDSSRHFFLLVRIVIVLSRYRLSRLPPCSVSPWGLCRIRVAAVRLSSRNRLSSRAPLVLLVLLTRIFKSSTYIAGLSYRIRHSSCSTEPNPGFTVLLAERPESTRTISWFPWLGCSNPPVHDAQNLSHEPRRLQVNQPLMLSAIPRQFNALDPRNDTTLDLLQPLAVDCTTHLAPSGVMAFALLHSLMRASLHAFSLLLHKTMCGMRGLREAATIALGLRVGRDRLKIEAMEMRMTALGVQLEEAMSRLEEIEQRRAEDVRELRGQVEEREREVAAVEGKLVEQTNLCVGRVEQKLLEQLSRVEQTVGEKVESVRAQMIQQRPGAAQSEAVQPRKEMEEAGEREGEERRKEVEESAAWTDLKLDVELEIRQSEGEQRNAWQKINLASQDSSLNLNGFRNLSDAILGHVCTMTHLRTIYLCHASGLSADGMGYLYKLPQLQDLDLSFAAIPDSALECIGSVSSLVSLKLGQTKVTDAGLAHLTRLSSLETLLLNGCKGVTSAGMVHVGRLTSLTSLWLAGTSVTDDGLQQLTALTKLTHAPMERLGSK